jgi:hypothetical protein
VPRLEFPLLPDGLIVDAVVGVDRPTTKAQIVAGQPITRPVSARGEVDTGTNMTAVSAAILRQLGVPALYRTTTQTTAGQLAVDVFEVSVGIRNQADPTGTELVEPQLLVMELTRTLPNVEVLIGLDILRGCRFLLEGPAGRFSFEF